MQQIYLDNNATTLMPIDVKKEMVLWCNKGNPSADYQSAKDSRKMMEDFRQLIGKMCNINPCCIEARDSKAVGSQQSSQDRFKVIFTSGASESNATIISGIIQAYQARSKKATIVCSEIEHKSILSMVKAYEATNMITLVLVKPNTAGFITVGAVKAVLDKTPGVSLLTIMHANNESGAINDIAAIGKLAHSYSIPFHSDTVQTFGKLPIIPGKDIDSFCVSFHKIHGPPGTGCLIVRESFWDAQISPLIYGSQNSGMRGGTENLPGIGASLLAFRITTSSRETKNKKMLILKSFICESLALHMPCLPYSQYMTSTKALAGTTIVFMSGLKSYLPNTILLSVVSHQKKICNVQLKRDLEKQGIIVSVGSACNTASDKASHVLYAMQADKYIRRGALRVSLGDQTTQEEADIFVKTFVRLIKG